eukprot:scaffold12582_cov48-Phaeocystis_antarctica.AAC.1
MRVGVGRGRVRARRLDQPHAHHAQGLARAQDGDVVEVVRAVLDPTYEKKGKERLEGGIRERKVRKSAEKCKMETQRCFPSSGRRPWALVRRAVWCRQGALMCRRR